MLSRAFDPPARFSLFAKSPYDGDGFKLAVDHQFREKKGKDISNWSPENARFSLEYLMADAVRRKEPIRIVADDFEAVYDSLAEILQNKVIDHVPVGLIVKSSAVERPASDFYTVIDRSKNGFIHFDCEDSSPNFFLVGSEAYRLELKGDGSSKINFSNEGVGSFLQSHFDRNFPDFADVIERSRHETHENNDLEY